MGISTFPAASGGITTRTLKQKVFNASGTFTYPTSSNFDGTVEVTCVGGGGGSGSFVHRTASTAYIATGGGGGGQVVSKKQLSILGKGNQTVTIGAGGSSNAVTGALFGRPSTFGSGYIRNLYPDPTLSKGLAYLNVAAGLDEYPETYNGSATLESSDSLNWVSGTNPPQPPAGTTYSSIMVSSNRPLYSQYMPVKASTSYTYVFSHTGVTSNPAVTCTPRVMWYTSAGVYISASAGTAFTTQTTTGTWTAQTNTITSPSTAAYGRLNWLTGGTTTLRFNGIQFAETAASITSVVYGGASGYAWSGIPDNSFTIGEDETLIAAQGGGGGWGAGFRVTNSGTQNIIPGHPGYTSGGFGVLLTGSADTSTLLVSGCGGGAGGSATGPSASSVGSSLINASDGNSSSAANNFKDGYYQWRGFYVSATTSAAFTGGDSYQFSAAGASYKTLTNFGENGKGIDGYGYGGIGSVATGITGILSNFRSSGVANPSISVQQQYYPISSGSGTYAHQYDGRPNTGNGANGTYMLGSQIAYEGANGGSGVVIVRWYE
jgi:hypothetical protein